MASSHASATRTTTAPRASAGAGPANGATIRVDHHRGDRFAIAIRDHTVVVDQPQDDGGDDTGPTPTELFVAGLASCVAHYARRYLARHDLDPDGLSVQASYEVGTRPFRVSAIRVDLTLPPGLPPERRDALLAVASHCTVHNSITTSPSIIIDAIG